MKNGLYFGPVLTFIVLSTTALFSQTKEPPYIEYFDCPDCEHFILKASDPEYPSMVGYGPHKYNGLMSVQVKVDETGKAVQANAVSGHTFFRFIVETAARDISFRPQKDGGQPIGFTLVVQYQVVSIQDGKILPKPRPIINGRAVSLPVPFYPESAKSSCASGFVDVNVDVDEFGNVEKAKAVRGDEPLWEAAEIAARKARFTDHGHAPRAKSVGKIRYNFPAPADCPVK